MQSIDLAKRNSDQLALFSFYLYASDIIPAINPAKKHEIPFSFLNILRVEQNIIFYTSIKSIANTPESNEYFDINAFINPIRDTFLNFINRNTRFIAD